MYSIHFCFDSRAMNLLFSTVVLLCLVRKSFQQFSAYPATGIIDVYSPFTAVEPVFTSNANGFGYRMYQSPLSINSQLDETYRLAALYWFLQANSMRQSLPRAPIKTPNRPRPPAPPTLKPEVPKPEEPKPEQPKPEEPKPEEPKPEQPTTAPEGVEPTAEPGLPAE